MRQSGKKRKGIEPGNRGNPPEREEKEKDSAREPGKPAQAERNPKELCSQTGKT
ncbi:hypothetical protein [Ectobacillus sp. sgz5001026]|uniref:hypothetical protein n=1 Tax=Ectobacillus sp. sgz5001026 TaxID=3242473 RepID=UPI0036D34DF7